VQAIPNDGLCRNKGIYSFTQKFEIMIDITGIAPLVSAG
jgi:hypothetical protein